MLLKYDILFRRYLKKLISAEIKDNRLGTYSSLCVVVHMLIGDPLSCPWLSKIWHEQSQGNKWKTTVVHTNPFWCGQRWWTYKWDNESRMRSANITRRNTYYHLITESAPLSRTKFRSRLCAESSFGSNSVWSVAKSGFSRPLNILYQPKVFLGIAETRHVNSMNGMLVKLTVFILSIGFSPEKQFIISFSIIFKNLTVIFTAFHDFPFWTLKMFHSWIRLNVFFPSNRWQITLHSIGLYVCVFIEIYRILHS